MVINREKNIEWEHQIIEEKIEELEEVAQILHTINEGLRVNGFFEDNTTVYVDKKQDKFVIIGKQKLRELADMLKTRPKKTTNTTWKVIDAWFEGFEKKLESLLRFSVNP